MCTICLCPLSNWPDTDELATPNLALCALMCGHGFHWQCLHARESRVRGHGAETQIISAPLVSQACPNCRLPWSANTDIEFSLVEIETSAHQWSGSDLDDYPDQGDADGSGRRPSPDYGGGKQGASPRLLLRWQSPRMEGGQSGPMRASKDPLVREEMLSTLT